ncbi:unnamed protein product, partial [Ixodes persulcatus]
HCRGKDAAHVSSLSVRRWRPAELPEPRRGVQAQNAMGTDASPLGAQGLLLRRIRGQQSVAAVYRSKDAGSSPVHGPRRPHLLPAVRGWIVAARDAGLRRSTAMRPGASHGRLSAGGRRRCNGRRAKRQVRKPTMHGLPSLKVTLLIH